MIEVNCNKCGPLRVPMCYNGEEPIYAKRHAMFFPSEKHEVTVDEVIQTRRTIATVTQFGGTYEAGVRHD